MKGILVGIDSLIEMSFFWFPNLVVIPDVEVAQSSHVGEERGQGRASPRGGGSLLREVEDTHTSRGHGHVSKRDGGMAFARGGGGGGVG